MHLETIHYTDGSQNLLGQLICQDNNILNQPAIILFPAFEGQSEFAIQYGKNLAEQGFCVFIADMYGDGASTTSLEACFDLVMPFLQDRELVRRRALLAFKTIQQQKMVNTEKIGAVGFCFGGMCMLEIARSGVALAAGVGLHSVLAKSTLPTHAVKTAILLLQGYQDPQVPPQELHHFAEEMQAADNNQWIFTYFGDAKHSFTDKKTGSFNAEKEKAMGREFNARAANFSFRYVVDFFKHTLC